MSKEVFASAEDTIAAIASPPGRGGIGVLRLSGPNCKAIASSLINKDLPARKAVFAEFHDDKDDMIDSGIALFFEKPRSYTGEDVLELHSHGAPAVLEQLLTAVLSQGARPANPGEFTERAYLNGKIDLLQAESVADIIESASSQAAKSAARTLEGRFSSEIQSLLSELVGLRAYVEGALDFPEEEIDFLEDGVIQSRLEKIIENNEAIYLKGKQGQKLQDGISMVILGKPNTGKSSFLNLLAGYDAAIVTDIPGTTRDLLSHDIVLDGMPINILDTAGIRQSDNPIEQEGIRRAKAAAENADIVIEMTDSTLEKVNNTLQRQYIGNNHYITIRNKIDLTGHKPERTREENTNIYLSAKTGEGLELFIQEIKERVFDEEMLQGCFTANQRHLDAIEKTGKLLKQAQEQLLKHHAGELLAEDLRKAQESLGTITGEFYPDDLLGEIFSRFCIGK